MNVLSCTRLTKRFGSTVAVSELDLGVPAGQVYGFLGPNGAGKTTTIRMLLGLITPTAGHVELLGRRLPDCGLSPGPGP
jgi:ABC-type multidrug transport system ATPase subunit